MTTALLNVVLINYFYGVPVKLFASVYLLFNLALIARDWRRLWAFFLAPVERIDRGTWGRWWYRLVVAFTIIAPTVKMLREGVEHRVFAREPLEGIWSVDERSGGAAAGLDRIYFEKDDVGFVRVGGRLLAFQKQLDGNQLRLFLAGSDDLSHDGWTLRNVADADAVRFPHALRGAIAIEGQTLHFDGTCDDQPCAMKLTREFPR